MPRISLQPNSAEFSKKEKQSQARICEMPGCSEKAEQPMMYVLQQL